MDIEDRILEITMKQVLTTMKLLLMLHIIQSYGQRGNDRGQRPEPNTQHWVWNGQNWVTSISYHPKDGEVTNGFNCLPPDGVAKNIITVGAIDDIFNGYQNSSDVKQVNTDFSSCDQLKTEELNLILLQMGMNSTQLYQI